MAHQNFDHSEFISVRYYTGNTTTYNSQASSDRFAHYGWTSGTPHLWFNGTHEITGAGSAAATGEGYMGIIRSRYFDLAPIRIEVDNFNQLTGAASVTVTMYSTTASLVDEDFSSSSSRMTRIAHPRRPSLQHTSLALYSATPFH